ncbi:MAG TPA: BatA domain-containing protein [Bacteroidales bacterium]
MSFNHPEFLFALFALLIPIIIHLFNFRRYKKVMFSNIEFLKNIKSETKKQNELKHLLVLLFRMLAILFLVLVFAGPELNTDEKNDENSDSKIKVIYIDNSFSMSAQNDNARLLDLAVENVRNLVENSASDTRFVLMTNAANSGKRVLTKETMLTEIEELKLSPDSRKLSDLLRIEQKNSRDNMLANREIFLFSDFQKSTLDFAQVKFDTTAFYLLLPSVQSKRRNILIDSCFISSPVLIPGKRVDLFISLKNGSESDYEKIPIKLTIDGKQKGVAVIDLKAGQNELVPITFVAGEKGWHEGVISIEDSPVMFDNQLYFTYYVKEKIRIIELNNGQAATDLRKFYESDSVFSFSEMNYRQIDLSQMQDADLVILNGVPVFSNGLLKQLADYTSNGGNLFFFPDGNIASTGNNDFLSGFQAGEFIASNNNKVKVSRINQQDELFKDAIEKIPENADLPVVNQHFQLKYPVNSGITPLVVLLNGDDFLVKKKAGNGQLYILTVPFGREFSNFSSHPLFIPVMYGATFSNKSAATLFYTIGKDNNLNTNISSANSIETPFSIKKINSDYTFIPEQQFISGKLHVAFYDNIAEDGIYSLSLSDSIYALYGFNYNRQESEMDFYSEEEIELEMVSLGMENFKIIDSNSSAEIVMTDLLGKESNLWKLFIILALLMLLAETLTLRYWK